MFVLLELEFRIYLEFRLFEEFNYYVFAVYISFFRYLITLRLRTIQIDHIVMDFGVFGILT